MNMKNYLGLFLLLLTGCQEAPTMDGIDMANAMETVQENPLSVSNYFSKVEYIPLETTDSSLVGLAPHVVIAKDIMVVSSLNQPLKIFDRHTGAYIANVGSIGQGPKEYAKGGFNEVNFWVDGDKELIYVQGWKNDFMVYDKTGKFVERIEVENENLYNLYNCYFLMDGNKIWGHTKLHADAEVPSVFCMDKDGKDAKNLKTWTTDLFSLADENLSISTRLGAYVSYGGHLTTIWSNDDKACFSVVGSPSLWKHDGHIRLKQAFNDTIYNVTENGLEPHEVIGLGKWQWKEADAFQTNGCNDKISIDYILESNEYLYFHLRTGLYDTKNTQAFSGFFHKQTKQLSLMKGDTMMDEANNQKLSIRGTTPDNGFYALITTDKLSEENISRLKLDEEANPVVVIVKP